MAHLVSVIGGNGNRVDSALTTKSEHSVTAKLVLYICGRRFALLFIERGESASSRSQCQDGQAVLIFHFIADVYHRGWPNEWPHSEQ